MNFLGILSTDLVQSKMSKITSLVCHKLLSYKKNTLTFVFLVKACRLFFNFDIICPKISTLHCKDAIVFNLNVLSNLKCTTI